MNQPPKSAGLKLALFGIVTLVWLAVAIYLGYNARHPDAYCAGTFSCLTASEWGDFLAGVFAPIAFLWLVAAVWIQSDELREQRNELALTRREFELNRSVMEQQAEEAKKQAEYVSTQTQLLLEESSARKKSDFLISFTVLISKYIEFTKENYRNTLYQSINGDGYIFKPIYDRISDEGYIYAQYEWIEGINNSHIDGGMTITNPGIFESSFVYIYSAEELLEKIPFHSRVSWGRSKLGFLVDEYCKIIIASPQFVHLQGHVKARENRPPNPWRVSEVSLQSQDV